MEEILMATNMSWREKEKKKKKEKWSKLDFLYVNLRKQKASTTSAALS